MAQSNKWTKDPDAILDYQVNWANWLGDDTISTSTWTGVSGVTVDSETETTTTATVWISGGTLGERGQATNRIVTAGGRTEDQTLYWDIRAK